MKKILVTFIAVLISTSSHASYISSDNYTSDVNSAFWTNNDLSLDLLRLSWSDTLGGEIGEQKTLAEIETYVANNQEGWRWATVNEFINVVNWFDTDSNNVGWSAEQNIGTNLFIELNGLGSKYHGLGAEGEVYQSGYDHEGYTYWQFGTFSNSVFTDTWIADFGEQFDSVTCPVWSAHCNSTVNEGYLDLNSPWGWSTYALGFENYNVAPLLVRATNVSEPTQILLLLGIAGLGIARLKRS